MKKQQKMRITRLLMLFAMSGMLFVQCKRDEVVKSGGNDNNNNNTNNTNVQNNNNTTVAAEDVSISKSVNEFFTRNSVPTQKFTIDASTPSAVEASKGTKINIPANALTKADGTPVTGEVEIEVIELYSKSDLIFADRPTSSGGEMLVTGGSLNLSANVNGEELVLVDGKVIEVEFPITDGDPTDDMDAFVGTTTEVADIDGNVETVFDWTTSPNSSVTWGTSTASGANFSYFFEMTGLEWINCDYFWGNGLPKIQVHVTCADTFDVDSTAVYFVFVDEQSVLQLHESDWDTVNENYDFISDLIPQGSNIHVLVVSSMDNQLYYSLTTETCEPDDVYHVELEAVSDEDLTTVIEGLNNN